MATEIPMLEDVTLFRWLSRGGTAIISVTGRREGRREVVHLTIQGGQVSALRVEARESSDDAERESGRSTNFRDQVAQPYDPDEHGSVSLGVLHARMIKCIGIRERDDEPRYGVCPYAVLDDDADDSSRESWGCRVCSGRRPVTLTLERIRDPRLACSRELWGELPLATGLGNWEQISDSIDNGAGHDDIGCRYATHQHQAVSASS
jgi:hypothetical protein